MVKIQSINAMEILDSRGNPTVMTKVKLTDGSIGVAKVPSGASTGKHEAVELRDGGKRYLGKGVRLAVSNVNNTLADALGSIDPLNQTDVDYKMLELDTTEGKSELGANAILSVSMATAVAAAKSLEMPLFQYLKTKVIEGPEKYLQPVPMSNVINGGAHAGNKLAIQEFMILPIGASNIKKAVQCISEIYHVLGKRMVKKYGRMAKHIGDEGGFCGHGLESTFQAFEEIMLAAEEAGYQPGTEIVLGIDAAASEFLKDGKYEVDGKKMDSGDLLDYYIELEKKFPLHTIEDPFDEEEFEEFAEYTKKSKNQIVTDDLTVSNPQRLKKAIDMNAGNALLLKVNQIGTVTEAIEAAELAYSADWPVVVSHRSGETGDTFIADLAVALSTGQIKTGAPARSDRVEKYNRLMEIHNILEGECDYPGAEFRTSWRDYQ